MSTGGDCGPTEFASGRPETTSLRRVDAPSHLLVGERAQRLYLFKPGSIDYIEANGNYVKFHAGDSDYISRDSLKRLSLLLASRGFFRIERSLLINVRAIAYVQPAGRGTYTFTMASGVCLRSGPRYRVHILRVLPLTQKTVAGLSAID